MSLTLLYEIQSLSDRYAAARLGYDESHARHDVVGTIRHLEHMIEAERDFAPLAIRFAEAYPELVEIKENTVVVWKRGSVGLQGRVTNLHYCGGGTLARVVTKRGVFDEFVANLMPLSDLKA